jgi:hypothetical protein
MFYGILIVIGFVVLYYIIKSKFTEYKTTEVFVLKNELTSIWLGGTRKPFNLIGNIPGLMGDKVTIERIDKIVFNKIVYSKFKINQISMDEDDSFY